MIRRFFLLLMCALIAPITIVAQGWDEAKYKQIEQSIRVPQFADKTYSITKYGAKVDNQSSTPSWRLHGKDWSVSTSHLVSMLSMPRILPLQVKARLMVVAPTTPGGPGTATHVSVGRKA